MAICFRSFPNRFITVNVNNFIATRKHVHRTVSSRDYPNESYGLNKHTEENCTVSNACLFDTVFSDEIIESRCTRNIFQCSKVLAQPNYTALAKEKCKIPDDIILWKTGIGSEVMKLTSDNYSSLSSNSVYVRSNQNNVMDLYRSYVSEANGISRENLECVLNLSSRLNMSSQQEMPNSKPSTPYRDSKPSIDQLENIQQVLSKDLPYIFVRPMDYNIYDSNLIFENNYRGVRLVGLSNYVTSISLMKLGSHLKFAYVKFEIINITKHPEEGSVKLRWRIRGLSGLKVFLLFWRIKVWKLKDTIKDHETWYDGFSVFYVNGEGKIYKHVLDKMQPDDDKEELVHKTPLAAKLGLLLGLTPRSSSLSDLSPMAWTSLSHLSDRDAELVSQAMAQLMLPLEKIE
ncbi:uncharacterized protein LOC111060353 [Nilaparvata lugens]|uniref:uncharacterized protein LOC111060353 n=1 Tax=Nilaparvata lugens TaxID=108931 RepID=UPI00193E66FF|nr:uncharacterized protein LOC111060353 [Nilaparvata lugens]